MCNKVLKNFSLQISEISCCFSQGFDWKIAKRCFWVSCLFKNGLCLICITQQVWISSRKLTWLAGKSPFLIGDTSSNSCFSQCHVSFLGCNLSWIYVPNHLRKRQKTKKRQNMYCKKSRGVLFLTTSHQAFRESEMSFVRQNLVMVKQVGSQTLKLTFCGEKVESQISAKPPGIGPSAPPTSLLFACVC